MNNKEKKNLVEFREMPEMSNLELYNEIVNALVHNGWVLLVIAALSAIIKHL